MRGLVGVAVALVVGTFPAQSRGQSVDPYFQIIVDTSGSMGECSFCATVSNSCAQLPATRLNAAKCVLNDLVNAYGDVIFGLTEFAMGCFIAVSPPPGPPIGHDAYATDCVPNDGANSISPDRARTLVPLTEENHASLLGFVDWSPSYSDPLAQSCPGDDEPGDIYTNNDNGTIDGGFGLTPLAGSLYSVQRYYQGSDPDFPSSPIASDPFVGCRPYYTILLTDGDETCAFGTAPQAGQANLQAAVDAAGDLRTTNVPGVGVVDIRTFVIGFGITQPSQTVEQIANAGGTTAFYAQNETELALAFGDIVADSLLVEVCNNLDDDCDGAIDEGFVKYCDEDGVFGTAEPNAIYCADPGDDCDNDDDNCVAGTADEPKNACGFCGPAPAEICNTADDDCDGFIDEGNVCAGCSPEPEICDGKDNDCDGAFDEGLTRPCGNNVGECTPGTQVCVEQASEQPAGTWGPCSGTDPSPELCDNLDNDCDGLIDGFAQECYTFADGCVIGVGCDGVCQTGFETCTNGSFSVCQGQIGPTDELCNLIDDNCNGSVDEGDPGGGLPCGSACGQGVTECQSGTIVCVGGSSSEPETCNANDDDCDGSIDEGVGTMGPCDENGTLCTPGELQCIGGTYQCVGGQPPEPEQCDCLDNDCDGSIDEQDAGSLCPPGADCAGSPHCLCVRPCGGGEFPCPVAHECVDLSDPDGSYCVPDACYEVDCEPLPTGEATICVDGECVAVCEGVVCADGFRCRPSDGLCVEDDCDEFPERCDADELCLDGQCIANPCVGVDCPAQDEFCRDGQCVTSCAGVDCPAGQRCDLGDCVDDPCDGVDCPDSSVCVPDTRDCFPDQCLAVSCAGGQICDPLTGDCDRDPCLGVECPDGEVCYLGNCWDPADLVPEPDEDYVTAAGGGCSTSGGDGGGSVLALLVCAAAIACRRRRS